MNDDQVREMQRAQAEGMRALRKMAMDAWDSANAERVKNNLEPWSEGEIDRMQDMRNSMNSLANEYTRDHLASTPSPATLWDRVKRMIRR